DDTKANAHVVYAEHLRVADVAPLSYQGEDGRFGWYLLDDIADIRMDPCQVEEAIARNVNECPHISDPSEQLDDLSHVDVRRTQQLFPERRGETRESLVDRDVVDHRKRCGSNAQQVIDVHCHTVDAEGVIPPEHLGDDEFRANAVGGEGKPGAADVDDIGEVANRELDLAHPGCWPRLGDATN